MGIQPYQEVIAKLDVYFPPAQNQNLDWLYHDNFFIYLAREIGLWMAVRWLVSQSVHHFGLEYLINFVTYVDNDWMNCIWIWYRNPCAPQEEYCHNCGGTFTFPSFIHQFKMVLYHIPISLLALTLSNIVKYQLNITQLFSTTLQIVLKIQEKIRVKAKRTLGLISDETVLIYSLLNKLLSVACVHAALRDL